MVHLDFPPFVGEKLKKSDRAKMARTARNSSLETRTARARLRIRRTPYFAKIAKGLRLGYYRGAVAGSWIARCYRGAGVYATEALGIADDTLDADGVTVLDYWQAQEHARRWGERQRLIAEGMLREGSYTVANAVTDYLAEITAEKSPAAVQGAKYVFDAWILPELGAIQVEKLTTDRINRWRNKLATQPKRVRTKRTATEPATRETADDEDARRARKATANRILTMLKAALNRAFHADRVSSDSAWRKVKPFKQGRRGRGALSQRRRGAAAGQGLPGGFPEAGAGRPAHRLPLLRARPPEMRQLQPRQRHAGDPAQQGQNPPRRADRRGQGSPLRTGPRTRRLPIMCSCAPTATSGAPRTRSGRWMRRASGPRISPAVTFHILRHTHGSHLAMNGVPMGVIAAQLGHADTRMTEKHYAHLAPSYVAQTIRANFPRLNLEGDAKVVRLPARLGNR